MAPSPSAETPTPAVVPAARAHTPLLEPPEVDDLFAIAGRSIAAGLRGEGALRPSRSTLPRGLRVARGVFVTLHVRGELNGCIGSIEGVEPLGVAVARHAWAAAFADPRLPPLQPGDVADLTIGISVLSPCTPVDARSRAELWAGVRPGADGLLIRAGARGAVFLPSVWEQLPDPDDFLDHLLAKAGLPSGGWPRGLRVDRFTATVWERPAVPAATN